MALLLINKSYSQTADSTNKLANAALQAFTWDIQKEKRGSLMFLDVEYQREKSDSTEFLTLTIAKDKSKQRPEFISVIVPNNIVRENGIFITFANSVTENGERTMEMQNANPVRLNFESCNNETCTARVFGGFANYENGEKDDVFKKFMTFDHILFLFIYPDGGHKSIAVPLFSFKRQYKNL